MIKKALALLFIMLFCVTCYATQNTKITNQQDLQAAIKSNKLVVFNLTAKWCMPCKRMHPHLEKAAQNLSKIKFFDVCWEDVEQDSNLEDGIQQMLKEINQPCAFPTLFYFLDGKIVGHHVGYMDYDELLKNIKSHLGN